MLEMILKNREDCLLKSYRDKHAVYKGIRPTMRTRRLLMVSANDIIVLQILDWTTLSMFHLNISG